MPLQIPQTEVPSTNGKPACSEERIGVVGLGYVGLSVALAFSQKFADTRGYDCSRERIESLCAGRDTNQQFECSQLSSCLQLTEQVEDLKGCTFFVVAVPTPVDACRQPDLGPLLSASEAVGRVLQPGSVVVYESTVYPGLTEEICGPVLEKFSGLRRSSDFKLAYSPERINPGDTQHTLERIVKVVAAEDEESLDRVARVYSQVVPAGVHRVSSIKTAEAAKVIENTQRDINIALMNELAMIFDRLGISTRDVLAAARTKWNFLDFSPGLVGGHCIGVDPYYLTSKAEQVGYHPQVILAGRRINDGMGNFIAQKLVKLLVHANVNVRGSRVAILGVSFKENVPDLRNSRVRDILDELREFGVEALLHDPIAEPEDVLRHFGQRPVSDAELIELDGVILAVAHDQYRMGINQFLNGLRTGGILVDVKSFIDYTALSDGIQYWSL